MERDSTRLGSEAEDELLSLVLRTKQTADPEHVLCVGCRTAARLHRVRHRRAYSCARCGTQTYPTAGTFLHGTKLPLTIWHQAVRVVLEDGRPVSTAALAAELRVTPVTASRMRTAIVAALEGSPVNRAVVRVLWAHSRASPPAAELPGDGADREAAIDLEVRANQRANAILESACRAFASRGLASTRVADIARDAGVSTATVHYYFGTKEDLMASALSWAAERSAKRMHGILHGPHGPVESLRELMLLWLPNAPSESRLEDLLWLEVYVSARQHPALLGECSRLYESWRTCLVAIIEKGVDQGVFRPVSSSHEVTMRIMWMLDGSWLGVLLDHPLTLPEDASRMLTHFVATQLRIPVTWLARGASAAQES